MRRAAAVLPKLKRLAAGDHSNHLVLRRGVECWRYWRQETWRQALQTWVEVHCPAALSSPEVPLLQGVHQPDLLAQEG